MSLQSRLATLISSIGADIKSLSVAVGNKLDAAAAPELIRDTIANALVQGTGITITPNDAGDTITITNSISPMQSTVTVPWTRTSIQTWNPKSSPTGLSTNLNSSMSGQFVRIGTKLYLTVSGFLLSYNADNDVWSQVATLPSDITNNIQLAAIGTKLYFISGRGPYNPTAACYVYDTASAGGFISIAPIPQSREYACCVVLDGLIYILAGSYYGAVNTVYCYNPTTNSWSTKTSTYATTLAGATSLNGKIYMSGGTYAGGYFSSYDPNTNAWTSLPNMPANKYGHALVTVFDKIYALAGLDTSSNGGSTSQTVYSYNPATNSWSTVNTSKYWSYAVAGAVIEGKIYVAPSDSGPGFWMYHAENVVAQTLLTLTKAEFIASLTPGVTLKNVTKGVEGAMVAGVSGDQLQVAGIEPGSINSMSVLRM